MKKPYIAPQIKIFNEEQAKSAEAVIKKVRQRQAKKVTNAYADLGKLVNVFNDSLTKETISEDLRSEVLFVATDAIVGSALNMLEIIKKVYPNYWVRGKRV